MSTIKSSNEHLTLNADGSSKDIKFQANGVEKASISSAGAFTSTTIDATKLTGNLPAISGASLTSLPADATKLPLAGGTLTGNLAFSSDGEISSTAGYQKVIADDTLYLKCDSPNAGGNTITFQHGTDTVMTISENGKTDWGNYQSDGSDYGFQIQGTTQQCTLYQSQDGNGNFDFHRYYNSSGYVGRVRWSSGSLSFENLSDYRAKENVVDMTNATARLKQLKPKRYNLIKDSSITLDGFLAHEVSSVCPEAVGGEKDAVDGDGNPDMQMMDNSKLIPLLVKTIQELEARITALEG